MVNAFKQRGVLFLFFLIAIVVERATSISLSKEISNVWVCPCICVTAVATFARRIFFGWPTQTGTVIRIPETVLVTVTVIDLTTNRVRWVGYTITVIVGAITLFLFGWRSRNTLVFHTVGAFLDLS
ncbi:MAG: hypothetical protein BWY72_02540 [Bacteroidetes bacterium ADurb.Bin416]|nr:MAG: hypothetical protein BWY72_02540 [Bacteroidetes bacterium ADurb.Bin416]